MQEKWFFDVGKAGLNPKINILNIAVASNVPWDDESEDH